MNFLSHYYLDRSHPSVYFKLGTILPDLVGGYNALMRKAVAGHEPDLPHHQQLKQGINRHHEGDKIFHGLPQFVDLQQYLKQDLKEAQLLGQLPRYWFWAHVAVEMLIDRNLLQLYPLLYVQFYDDLETVSQPVVENYFGLIGRNQLATDFFRNFKVFTERRFLQYYPSDEQFTQALFRAWYRATGNTATPAVHERARQVLLRFERQHADLLSTILDTVAGQLKNAT